MNEMEFKVYLKRKGKKENVIERNLTNVKAFLLFLENERKKINELITEDDIQAFVDKKEKEKKSAKGSLYVLMNYFKFLNNKELFEYTRNLREERTKKARRIFPLKEFLDINPDHVKKLAEIGITNVEQMLDSGKTKNGREKLSKNLNIPEEAILELVRLSDLTRIGYIKTKLTRLYYNSGLDSPIKVAKFEPDELYNHFKKYVKDSGWDGMVPNKADLVNNIDSARKLKKIVEE